MPQSLAKLIVHVIFSTKNRADLITPTVEPDLFGYMSGLISNNQSRLIAANGTANHVHLLVSLGKTIALSELIGDIKRDSSKWLKTQSRNFQDFRWQEGYGAFSVGQTEIEKVTAYIARQKDRHAQTSFENELRHFLDKYSVSYDERYVWD